MTSRECFENKWFYMKYIGKYFWPVSVYCVYPAMSKIWIPKQQSNFIEKSRNMHTVVVNQYSRLSSIK
jgi:hypothetical protein